LKSNEVRDFVPNDQKKLQRRRRRSKLWFKLKIKRLCEVSVFSCLSTSSDWVWKTQVIRIRQGYKKRDQANKRWLETVELSIGILIMTAEENPFPPEIRHIFSCSCCFCVFLTSDFLVCLEQKIYCVATNKRGMRDENKQREWENRLSITFLPSSFVLLYSYNQIITHGSLLCIFLLVLLSKKNKRESSKNIESEKRREAEKKR
jgi:hypothetical protein